MGGTARTAALAGGMGTWKGAGNWKGGNWNGNWAHNGRHFHHRHNRVFFVGGGPWWWGDYGYYDAVAGNGSRRGADCAGSGLAATFTRTD